MREGLLIGSKGGAANAGGEGSSSSQVKRSAVSSGDGGRNWGDDMHRMSGSGLDMPRRRARSAAVSGESTETQCAKSCDANGYSRHEAGPAAARACIDVCLAEKGHGKKGPGSLTKEAVGLSSAARGPAGGRGEEQLAARGRRMPSTPIGLAREGPSLQSFMKRQGVSSVVLPRDDAKRVEEAEELDNSMRKGAAAARSSMKKVWEEGVRGMAKYESARLSNAHNLVRTTNKALTDNRAMIEADARIMQDASAFASTGQESSLPVDLNRAKEQLKKARGREAALEQAASGAAAILREEERGRAGGLAHAQGVLAAQSWRTHKGEGLVHGWGSEVEDAREMPSQAAGAVRLAAMSEGKLRRMEEKLYTATKAGEERLADDVRSKHQARVASAQLLEGHLAKEAEREGREARLARAKEAYLGNLREIGGRGAPSADEVQKAREGSEREGEQARELEMAGAAAEGLLRSVGVDPSRRSESDEELRGRIKAARSSEDGAEEEGLDSGSAAGGDAEASVGDFEVGVNGEDKEGSKKQGSAGAAAVEDASKGWFSW